MRSTAAELIGVRVARELAYLSGGAHRAQCPVDVLEGLFAHVASPDPAVGLRAAAALRRLAVPTKQGVVLVSPDEISHAVFDGALVTVHAGDKRLLTDHTLQELEDRLPKATFERVHRRALLNLEAVVRLDFHFFAFQLPLGVVVTLSLLVGFLIASVALSAAVIVPQRLRLRALRRQLDLARQNGPTAP